MSKFKRIREFIEGEDAKADDIEAEFDNIGAVLNGGITGDNIANGAVGKAQVVSGLNHRVAFVSEPIPIGAGSQQSEIFVAKHGLGETPIIVGGSIKSAPSYDIVIEVRIIAFDAENVSFQLIASTPIPGSELIYFDTMIWVWAA